MLSKPQGSPARHEIPCKICRRRTKKAATLLRLLFLFCISVATVGGFEQAAGLSLSKFQPPRLAAVATAGGFDKLNHRDWLRLPPLVVSTSSTTETGYCFTIFVAALTPAALRKRTKYIPLLRLRPTCAVPDWLSSTCVATTLPTISVISKIADCASKS
jgi:hypothetical protein